MELKMDWQEQLITLFVNISKYYDDELLIHCQRFSNNTKPHFSDIEVISIYLWGIMRGYSEIKEIYNYTHDHLLEWFPKLPAYSTYVDRLNRVSAVFCPMIEKVQEDFYQDSEIDMIRLIDSMPIMMAKSQRSGNATVAPELANKGYNSTKKTYYYGVKVHILAFRRAGKLPIPNYISVTPASESDINVLKNIACDIYSTPVYADKAYISKELSDLLEHQDSHLYTPVKKEKGQKNLTLFQKAFSTMVSEIRQPIESLFNWIHEKTGIQIASKVRSTQGLLVHVFGKIAAAMMLLSPSFNP